MADSVVSEAPEYEKKPFKLNGDELSLWTSRKLFLPNAATRKFAEAIQKVSGVVLDIGTGVAPLAIYAARHGAQEVHAVDIVEEHIKLAKMNVEEHGLVGKVMLYWGSCFAPLYGLKKKADHIIADISGIARKLGVALGWYNDLVPAGGEDGTEKIIKVLEEAPDYLAEGGKLHFPIAIDLSDGKKIMDAALRNFNSIVPAFEKAIRFFLSEDEVRKLQDVYNGILPPYINIGQQNTRYFWTGQIYAASNPK